MRRLLSSGLLLLLGSASAGRLDTTVDAWSWSRESRGHVLLPAVRRTAEWSLPDGRLLRKDIYLRDGSLLSRTVWTWDSDPLPSSCEVFDASGRLRGRSVFRKERNGSIETLLRPDGTVAFLLYRRQDSAGRTLELLTVDASSNLLVRKTFHYDSAGALLHSTVYDDRRRPLLLSTFSYPDPPPGRLIRDETVHFGNTSYPKERVTFSASNIPLPPRPRSPVSVPSFRLTPTPFFDLARHARGPGARVLAEALRRIKAGERFQGSCYAWVDSVFTAAGFPTRRRTVIWNGSEAGPFADPLLLLQPGDWVMFRNQTYGDGGHSGIFLAWLDLESRTAVVASYAGERRIRSGSFKEYDITRTFRILRGTP